ncbi:MAG: NifU family protein [Candidatus Kapaibacteriales bacterium]
MSENEKLYEIVSKVIDTDVRPFIEADGGKIKLKKVENGIVWVQLSGACSGCPGAIMTLRGGVERVLKAKIKEIKTVKLAY